MEMVIDAFHIFHISQATVVDFANIQTVDDILLYTLHVMSLEHYYRSTKL